MCSRAAEVLVILALRVCFVLPNKSRDKRFSEGAEECDPSVQVYEDVTDKVNLHFRYVA